MDVHGCVSSLAMDLEGQHDGYIMPIDIIDESGNGTANPEFASEFTENV